MFPAIIDILRLAFINFFILEGFLCCIHSFSLVSRPYLSGLGMGFLSDFHPLSHGKEFLPESFMGLLSQRFSSPVLLKDCVSLGLSQFLTPPSHVTS